jgi:hypothetical protein
MHQVQQLVTREDLTCVTRESGQQGEFPRRLETAPGI